MKRKIVFLVGIMALLVGMNMQVEALNLKKNMALTHNVKTEPPLDEWMPDKNLQQALVTAMNLRDISQLTQEALNNHPHELMLRSKSIKNIKGLEYATSISIIDISSNFISDLGSLSELTGLRILNAYGNKELSDVSPLSKLTQLKDLSIWATQVSDLTPLANLSNLESLSLNDNNQVRDISPLSGLKKLQNLYLHHNQISDLGPLAGLDNLRYLGISDNQISNLNPISELQNLHTLHADNNQISDLSPLLGMKDLNKLQAHDQIITNKELVGYAGYKIKQNNNIVNIDKSKVALHPSSSEGVYDEVAKVINWTYENTGQKEAISTFDVNLEQYDGTFSGRVVQPIMVKEDMTSIEVKDSTLYLGQKWQPEDNIVKAVDKDGNPVSLDKIEVEGSVDTSKEGISKVKYTILNHKNEKISQEATITVKENQTDVEVKNYIIIYLGDSWKPEDSFVKAIDKDGNPVPLDQIDVKGTVDTKKEGTYEVVYFLSSGGKHVWSTARIIVRADKTSIEVQNSTLYFGDTWQPEDNFVKATDKFGSAVDIKDITVEGNVDTSKEGDNKVQYSVLNHKNEKISKEATITVKGNDLTALELKGSTLYINDKWNPQDNIVKAIDKDGKVIDIKDIIVEGQVDTTVAGEYVVKYTILNHKQEPLTRATIVKVKEDLTSLKVKDSILYFGDGWEPEDNLVKATDKDGNLLDIYDVQVEGHVDIETAGEYKVKYTILNSAKEKITKEATIIMRGHDLTYLQLEDSTLYLNDKWNPVDNLIKARDKDGKKLEIEDVLVEGKVNTHKIGKYKVTYTLMNHVNKKVSKNAIITVQAKSNSIKDKLPKTGYDLSIIGYLLGIASILGAGSIYLSRKQ